MGISLDTSTLSTAANAAHGRELRRFVESRRAGLRQAEPAEGRITGQQVPGGAVGIPVLAALAPVVTGNDGVVEYPGDPMCLYAALTHTIERWTRHHSSTWADRDPVHDIVPGWGRLPDTAYRLAAGESGIRTPLSRAPEVTDELVFDPRVWNETTRGLFQAILERLRPRMLLLSSVSAAHRYALEMARIARELLPQCFVVLGGRHADETMRMPPGAARLELDRSATLALAADGRAQVDIDAVVSGEGSPLLDLLATAACSTVPDADGWVAVDEVPNRLRALAGHPHVPAGRGIIGLRVGHGGAVAFPFTAAAPAELMRGSPYRPFAIRSRFTVFAHEDGGARRTAHIMTAPTCPFQCTFCSESSAVMGRGERLGHDDRDMVLRHLAELVSYGAEAVFFDDPVLWSGSWPMIEDFASELERLRNLPDDSLAEVLPPLATDEPRRRWRSLLWGGQLTIDLILDNREDGRVPRTLAAMRRAGCTYIYIGIESMSEQVMRHVRKNLRHRNGELWETKVRAALELVSAAGVQVGSSVLFGLDGEDRTTIEHTIEHIGKLIDESLLVVASPNILTYHPATAIARAHGKTDLDYHSPMESAPPYTYFEEAYEKVVTDLLTTEDIWHIHELATKRWGSTRNAARVVAETEMRTP